MKKEKNEQRELVLCDSDGYLYIKGSNVYWDGRSGKKPKHFHSNAEAEAYVRSMIGKYEPKEKKPYKSPEEMYEKHKKSHRLKKPK